MNRVSTAAGEFARRGFEFPSSAARVWQDWCAQLGGDPPVPLQAFTRAADRDQALECLANIGKRDPALLSRIAATPDWLERVLLVMGGSSVLARFLVKNPEELRALASEPEPRRGNWLEYIRSRVVDEAGQADADRLRRANHAALVEIAARDLACDDPIALVDDIAAELSHLADAILECALDCARASVPESTSVRLAVIAMGKTGARELNYISDVDVIYVAEPAGDAGHEEAMCAGAKVAAAVARICSAHTAEGTIWPVDAALRPEGNAGPLVRSLESCAAYYRQWAKNWEFQALLKARPAAGDKELGQAFCDLVSPLVWEAAQRPGFLSEVRAMRNRVISLIPAKEAGREIKLGAGGLRDTEFTVQLLQLVHGRGDERVRARGTFDALRALIAFSYIGRVDGAAMAEAYRTQRVLEHRVQLRRLRRTHLVPDDDSGWAYLARSTGRTTDEVKGLWRSSTRAVERLQQRIFFSPLLDAVSAIPTAELRLSADAAQERLRVLGFEDARAALGHIQALTNGSSRAVEIQRQLMPVMLGWFAEGPNPDFGLLAFRQLSEALGASSWYLRALRDEGWMAQRLARIASSSRYVVNLLMRAPQMVQMLANREGLEPRPRELLSHSMKRDIGRASDQASAVASVRALRRSELCRVALADVLGSADVTTVGLALSDLAGATLDAALEIARHKVDAPQVGVIGMGRWSGCELGYASDVDAMFVIPDDSGPDGQVAAARLVRLACDLVGRPGPDPAMVVDADLRPEGKGGPLVRTKSSYLTYYAKWASAWEAQALLRARPAAGAQELAAAVLDELAGLRYPQAGVDATQIAEIRRLKLRMATERIPRGTDKERHLKLGPGGLSDIEWTIQLLQLQHAGNSPALRTPSTLKAIDVVEGLELLTGEQAASLRQAWLHVSRVRNAIMLVRGRPSDVLPIDYQEQAAVAELAGYGPGQHSQLVEDTIKVMRHALRVVNQIFWEDATTDGRQVGS